MVSPLLSERARTVRSSAVRDLLRLTEQPHVLSLAGGLPAPELLPVERIASVTAEIFRDSGAAVLQYGPTEGSAALRETVATRLGDGALASGTIVTTGSQQALDLVGRVLLDPHDVVVTEMPTYLGALSALHWQRPQLVGIDGDEDGLRTDLLADSLRAGLRPKLVYVVTDFANPTGATLSLDRRRELAALADRYGFVVVEDDPYGALRFRGDLHPPIRTWSDRVVTLGSASKVLSPGLRVGWLTAPEWLARAVVIAKQGADLHTAGLNQAIVHRLLGDREWFAAHVAHLVRDYRVRAARLSCALTTHLGDRVRFREPDGGMFVWATLADPAPATDRLLAAAIDRGVAFVPGAAFRSDGADVATLRLCFTTQQGPDLDEAMRRLAAAVSSTW
jgi:2-aminoadipate transaminase